MDTIPDIEFGTTQYVLSVSRIQQNLLKGRRLYNWKQNAHWHWIWMRENGGSLDFNFISLPNPMVDKNGFFDIVCCSSSSENDAMYNVPVYSDFLWTAVYWTFSLFFVNG